ncbi:MAG: hypothetical protein WDN72_00270 [Alphaproteobacteria bacterium]
MKKLTIVLALAGIAPLLSACGGTDTRETVIHDRPVVVQQPASTTVVSPSCQNGYDASTNSCY